MILVVDLNSEENSLSSLEFILPILRILDICGLDHCVVHYRKLTPGILNTSNGVILSGTPLMDNGYYDNLDQFEWLKSVTIPILGICAGMQFIALLHGSKITPCLEIGMTSIRSIQSSIAPPDVSFPSISPHGAYEAYSLHRNAIIPSTELEVLAESEHAVQAFRVHGKHMFGVLFHPEVRNPEIIEKFVSEYCMMK
jgi:GMP synthase-like glutamine amidotransferase